MPLGGHFYTAANNTNRLGAENLRASIGTTGIHTIMLWLKQ